MATTLDWVKSIRANIRGDCGKSMQRDQAIRIVDPMSKINFSLLAVEDHEIVYL